MRIDQHWIYAELLSDFGLRRDYKFTVEIYVWGLDVEVHRQRKLADSIRAAKTPWGTVESLVGQILHGVKGSWFYAGWIDQAVLHVGQVAEGDSSLFDSIVSQMDEDQVDQSGDMVVGFLPVGEEWFLAVEAKPDDRRLEVLFRTNSRDEANGVKAKLGIPCDT